MATKIFYSGNRIIFDGHADSAQECMAITAMCDSMAASENFKTIVYEKGHAVFERVCGGESGMFQALQEQVNALDAYVKTLSLRVADLEYILPATAEVGQYLKVSAVDENGKITALEAIEMEGSSSVDLSNYVTKDIIGTLPEDTAATTIVEYVDEKTASTGGGSSAPEYKLPFTASEVAEKLGKIE